MASLPSQNINQRQLREPLLRSTIRAHRWRRPYAFTICRGSLRAPLELLQVSTAGRDWRLRCRASARRLVFTYRRRDRQDITARREKGWVNDFSHDDMRAMLQRTGWTAIIAEKVPGSGLPYLCAAE